MAVRLETERVELRTMGACDAAMVLQYYRDNAAHLGPWDPPRPRGFLTEAWWIERLAKDWADLDAGRSCRMFLLLRSGPDAGAKIIGNAALSNVVRGAMQGASVGYSIAADALGQGLMTEALRDGLIKHAFRPRAEGGMGLHRLQAGYVPDNERSGAVLHRLGFDRIGVAKEYLHIGGQWRDHVLMQLIAPSDQASAD